MTIIRFDQRVETDPGDDYRRTVLLGESDFDCTADIDSSVACIHCDEQITEYPHGWTHDDTGGRWCEGLTDEEAAEKREAIMAHEEGPEGIPTVAEPGKSLPGNWVGMTADADNEAVAVQISVGDPRGCFEFTLRRWVDPEDGKSKLLLHMPHPEDSTPHATLTHHHKGTYIVG